MNNTMSETMNKIMDTADENIPQGYKKTVLGVIPEDWEVVKLGDVAKIQRGASPRPIADSKWFSTQSKIGWVRISDVTRSSKYLEITEQYLSDDGVKKSRAVPVGSIIMSICATIGKPIYTTFPVCIHDGFVVFTDLVMNTEYLYYYLYLLEESWHRYGQPGSQVNLNTDIVNNEFIILPPSTQQQKIAEIISCWDNTISKQEALIKQKQLFKKGVMQQIFSQKLRFKDEVGNDYPDWEEKRLGDLLDGLKGSGLSKEDLLEDGNYECILYGELYTQYQEVIKAVVSKTNKYEGILSKLNDLLIPASTTTNGIDLANVVALNYENILLGGDITILRNKQLSDNIFYAYYLTHYKKYQLARLAQGSTIVHLYYSHFKNLDIDYPSLAEQQKIADFLTNIDEQIELLKQELEQLRLQKKSLMQKLLTGKIRVVI